MHYYVITWIGHNKITRTDVLPSVQESTKYCTETTKETQDLSIQDTTKTKTMEPFQKPILQKFRNS
jgi:hypothetical protein